MQVVVPAFTGGATVIVHVVSVLVNPEPVIVTCVPTWADDGLNVTVAALVTTVYGDGELASLAVLPVATTDFKPTGWLATINEPARVPLTIEHVNDENTMPVKVQEVSDKAKSEPVT